MKMLIAIFVASLVWIIADGHAPEIVMRSIGIIVIILAVINVWQARGMQK